jgi:hypothetical protein
MARSSGTYTAPASSVAPAVSGTPIESDDFNALVEDIETALTESVYTAGLGATDNRIVRTDGTDTKRSQGSAATLDDNGCITIAAATATPANGATTVRLAFGSTAGFGIYVGSGAPTVTAAQGSLYLRSDGSGTTSRAYINTDGSTTWTALTTVA